MISRVAYAALIISLFTAVFFLPKDLFLKSQNVNAKGASHQISQTAVKNNNFQNPPQITADSAEIIDATTGHSLYDKNANTKHLAASTTKLMTALVALEQCTPQTVVKIDNVIKTGSQMGLSSGDQVTVENLLYGLLIPSGNDAAYALAYGCAPSFNNFIQKMNEKARSLGMINTHYVNPAGFDSPYQFSSAADLAHLAKVAVANPLVAKIVDTKSTVVTDVTGQRTYYLENVNKLLGVVNGVVGIKTGETDGALEILITKTTRDGNSVITVVMGSKHRFEESQSLIEWVFSNYHWVKTT